MKRLTEEYLINSHSHSSMHRAEILKSELCSCFYCLKNYAPGKIEEWTDEKNSVGQTAICPFCGIDSVLGSASGLPVDDTSFLKEMQRYFF